MAETDPKSVQDLTNVVSRDRWTQASVSYSNLASNGNKNANDGKLALAKLS